MTVHADRPVLRVSHQGVGVDITPGQPWYVGIGADCNVRLPVSGPAQAWFVIRHAGVWTVRAVDGQTSMWLDGVAISSDRSVRIGTVPIQELHARRGPSEVTLTILVPALSPAPAQGPAPAPAPAPAPMTSPPPPIGPPAPGHYGAGYRPNHEPYGYVAPPYPQPPYPQPQPQYEQPPYEQPPYAPVVEPQIIETPVAHAPVIEEPVGEAPMTDHPVAEAQSEEAVSEAPVIAAPVIAGPVIAAPVAEAPMADLPVAGAQSEVPVAETRVAEAPVVDTTVAGAQSEAEPALVTEPVTEPEPVSAPVLRQVEAPSERMEPAEWSTGSTPVAPPMPATVQITSAAQFLTLMKDRRWPGFMPLSGGAGRGIVLGRSVTAGSRSAVITPGPDGLPVGEAADRTIYQLLCPGGERFPAGYLLDQGMVINTSGRVFTWSMQLQRTASVIDALPPPLGRSLNRDFEARDLPDEHLIPLLQAAFERIER